MMPPVKLANLLVQTSYLLSLPENPEAYSRALLNFITDNEASAATHEFYATELVERGEAERWSTSPDEDFKRVGLRRLKELDEAAEYESIRDVPQENWQLYRYVVARQLREAFEEAGVNPSEFFSESAKLKAKVHILSIEYVVRALRIIAEGAGMQEAIKEAARPASEDIEGTRRNYEILFGRDVADEVVKGILSDRAFFMESPEQVFQQLCSEEYEGFVGEMIEGLLLLHPFNRVFSESLILISEEDENVSISICIPEDLKEYLDIRNHLFPALLASKAMLLKLWKTAGSEELYEAYLKSVEKVKVKDVTVEMPMTRGSIKRLKSLEAWRRTESLKNRQKDSG